jgi:hypothetical protein
MNTREARAFRLVLHSSLRGSWLWFFLLCSFPGKVSLNGHFRVRVLPAGLLLDPCPRAYFSSVDELPRLVEHSPGSQLPAVLLQKAATGKVRTGSAVCDLLVSRACVGWTAAPRWVSVRWDAASTFLMVVKAFAAVEAAGRRQAATCLVYHCNCPVTEIELPLLKPVGARGEGRPPA